MKNKDIVVVGLQSWDIEIGSNCKNIALEFARHNRVLYVNRAVDRISALRRKNDPKTARRLQSLRGAVPDLQSIGPNLWTLDPRTVVESVNWMPAGAFQWFNRINNRRIARAIRAACGRLGFTDIILFIDNDFFRAQYLPDYLQPETTIYYVRDYLVNQPYFKKHGAEAEAALMKKATFVVANSGYLADYGRKHNPNAFDIGQGCDLTAFRADETYPVPEDMAALKGKPVIGYVGALVGYRLDIPLLEELARRRRDWNWVLVGPEDEAFRGSALHSLDNVHFLGRKPETTLAGYLAHFNVCMNPQQVNEITVGNYPRKVDEYLAMGKPVVATFTDFMKSFSGYVYLCRNAEEYIRAIETALAEAPGIPQRSERISFALSHTWEASVDSLYRAYQAVKKEQPAYAGAE
ncbi:MAG TPA: glycosyltransferase [Chitinophagaceae bacterium]|jgi:glycosyltransferase involved in cell wall biosynthesis|nr:glycosyltransferase [Chitinophagaceae bacterium]